MNFQKFDSIDEAYFTTQKKIDACYGNFMSAASQLVFNEDIV